MAEKVKRWEVSYIFKGSNRIFITFAYTSTQAMDYVRKKYQADQVTILSAKEVPWCPNSRE